MSQCYRKDLKNLVLEASTLHIKDKRDSFDEWQLLFASYSWSLHYYGELFELCLCLPEVLACFEEEDVAQPG